MQTADIVERIAEEMEHNDLQRVMRALNAGWSRINPGWELAVISLPEKDKEKREEILREAMRHLIQIMEE